MKTKNKMQLLAVSAAARTEKRLMLTEHASSAPFTPFGDALRSGSEWTIERIRERVDSSSEVLERILHKTVRLKPWGINE
ncbi:MAG: hypothetical protein ABI042_20075 [Verrucomicrobiota bacterium]